ncbi:hypothetical protein GCM10010441_24580 [Kitasatospora paracochleata]|uniref:Uncharacterized protein n=1 Tax=Kitasatospora paracochleata TaxID=58354 RepID=A0ABT1J0R5_9ACTN|nr:hypothetical protein [Kitasatospora paracochleata]MCP2311012.1 hypothetical protein [Kitasatospora paracochleata]
MEQLWFRVDVPIRSTVGPDRHGLHVLVGQADSGAQALWLAREACEAALAARTAGLTVPLRRPDGWTARGVRPGWGFDWSAATVVQWERDSLLRALGRVGDVAFG